MKACIVYSSCTGNTRKVAEALAETSGIACFAVRHAPNPDDYDLLALGFWDCTTVTLPPEISLQFLACASVTVLVYSFPHR